MSVFDANNTSLLRATISHSGSTPTDVNYQIVTADTATTTLRFTSTDPAGSNHGIALDAIAVTPVPEPSTPLLLGLGQSGCLVASLHRRTRAGTEADGNARPLLP